MSIAATGAAFVRPLYGADHVKVLMQTAASCSSAHSSAGHLSRKGVWSQPRQSGGTKRTKTDGLGFLGQHVWTGTVDNICKYSQNYIDQRKFLPMTPCSRVREGGADSESKGSNPSFGAGKDFLKKEPSLLLSLVQEIQPLDVSHISREVSPDSMDAMKRTISGMLGLLPSDQFHVTVETSQEPLEKLFVSSMMTGYTLRNAEYRLCLQKSLEFSGDNQLGEGGMSLLDFQGGQEEVNPMLGTSSGKEKDNFVMDVTSSESCFQDHHSLMEDWKEHSENFASISDDARHYIQHLKQKLASVAKELEEYKQMNSGLQVQGLVGEEKNDLLDYLRSLPPEKVAELSQPTSSEVEEVIQKVINGLLDNPITELHYKSGQFANRRFNSLNIRWKDEVDKELSSSPVQSQSAILVNRDHLARLLFWCMLLGHYMRGLEYRLELSRTLSLCEDLDAEIPTEIE